jgi:hypothetical protein
MANQPTIVQQQLANPTTNWVSNSLNVCSLSQPANPLFEIVPRRADRIFTNPVFTSPTVDAPITGTMVRNRLPKWRSPQARLFSLDSALRIREMEYRFFTDFATQIQQQWWSKRKLSVLCLYRRPNGQYRPVVNVPVRLTRTAADHPLRFVLGNGNTVLELSDSNRPRTDNQGIAEFTVAHPVQQIAPNHQRVSITAEADIPLLGPNAASTSTTSIRMTSSLALLIRRNNDVTAIADIYNLPTNPESALNIWCFQPAAPENANAGIRELQEAINEVVSRHRGIANFQFVPLTGIFDSPTRTALKYYVSKFRTIAPSPNGYPYNLSTIGPDPDVLTLIKEDYAPFDPTTDANMGVIVDRRFLIGDQLSLIVDRIDGLWELYQGVVLILRNQMREYGQGYLNCDTFWLHRTMHGPYSQAVDTVFGCTNNNVTVRTAAANAAQPLMTAGNPTTIGDGDHFLVQSQAGQWVQINHASGLGWVPLNMGVVVRNDRGAFRVPQTQVRNHGALGIVGAGYAQNHSANGVAYTYGGKQTPDEWRNSLLQNQHANPNQIVNYSEYAAGYRFGETKAEYDNGDMTHKEAGCDCSGFVQNCIVHAFFPGTNTRIVPAQLINNVWLGSSQFIGANLRARPVPRPLNDHDRHWVRGADIIQHPGHIVMVSEDIPAMLNDATDFKIMQESGSAVAGDITQFRRKSVRSPFSWWNATHAGFTFGKVYIWI